MSSNAISRRQGKGRGRRPQRKTSNVFAMFDQKQIQEFKEAFNMIDQNKNQIVDKEDLAEIYASLGKDHPDDYLQAMLDDAPGPINFTGAFLGSTARKVKKKFEIYLTTTILVRSVANQRQGDPLFHDVPDHVRGEAQRHGSRGRHKERLPVF